MSTAGAKVTVASKLPMAFLMQCCSKRTQRLKNGATVWEEEVFFKDGPAVKIAGTAIPRSPDSQDEEMERAEIASGAALTFGVPKDLWDRWLVENRSSPMVTNGLVFAHEKTESVKAKAREQKAQKSGFEPLVPDSDLRMPKKISAKTAREAAKTAAAD